MGPYQISYDGYKKHDNKDFIKKNILSTADMQGLLERFIVEKYESQLFSNKNIDGIA